MKVKVKDEVKLKEKLTNNKPWFNGMHTFSSVKIIPGYQEDTPSVLEVNVSDNVDLKEKIG